MTLVLPYGPDQLGNSPLYSGGARNSNMPCVFDEALDFESALMTADWNSDINYETPADDFTKAPSDGTELKRKVSANGTDAHPSQSKKLRIDAEDSVSPMQTSDATSSSSSSDSYSSSSPSSSSSSSSSDGHEDDAASTAEAEEDDYVPRRRGPQMWNSRQRWKDERKRVLKLSISKLAEIEDPELCMHRSVVINNTVKRLHMDIKNERQAKLRHRQQRMDFIAERFHSISSAEHFNSNFDAPREDKTSRNSDLYDDSSCDEMFGVSEDFLRVTIPDRRVSSPIPTTPVSQSNSEDSRDSAMDTSEEPVTTRDTQTTCYTSSNSLTSCDTAADSASTSFYPRRTNVVTSSSTGSSSRRLVSNSGSQCATQFRTSRDVNSEGSFPPRVPILDSVVYHSLLASLESS